MQEDTMKKKAQHKSIQSSISALIIGTLLSMLLTFTPTPASAQVGVGIQIGGAPPSCPYGYYDYAPYGCAPSGYWGPEYFYNGVFIGVGPWWGWGYRHGWGGHRFRGYYRYNGREFGRPGWDRGRGDWHNDHQRGEWNEGGHWRREGGEQREHERR
jgi:hypothetical protein